MRIYRNPNREYKSRDKMTEKEKEKDDIYNSDTILEKIINSKKIKYIVLDDLFTSLPKNVDTLTFYIDIDSLLATVYNKDVLESTTSFDSNKKFVISSSIINMAAHYRNYFATRRGLYTNFIFFYATEKSTNEVNILPEYRMNFYNQKFNPSLEYRTMNELLNDNLKLCRIITDYIPGVYFIDSKNINPLTIPYHFITNTQGSNELSIIYSNDKMQMLNLLAVKDNVCMLNNRMNKITVVNKMDMMYKYVKCNDYDDLNPYLLPYLFAISGYSRYSIKGVKGLGPKKTCNLVKKLIDDNVISNINYENPELFINSMNNVFDDEKMNQLKNTIELTHIPTMFDKVKESDKLKIFNLKDLIDLQSLIDINKEYYEKFPIMIEELLIGEEYESVN